MQPEDAVLVRDMIEYTRRAIEAARGRDRSHLDTDPVLSAALERFVEVIGEAASKTSDALRQSAHDIPWREIIGMRNRLAHGYASVDQQILWDVVTVDLPKLMPRLEKLVGE